MRFPRGLGGTIAQGLICIGLFAACGSVAFAVPAQGGKGTLTQPDGTVFQAYHKGDEFYHWYQTLGGFVISQGRDGFWRYVVGYNANGDAILGTARVGIDPQPAGLRAGGPPPAVQRAKVQAAKERWGGIGAQLAPGVEAPVPGAVGRPPVRVEPRGTVGNLVILCMFSDHSLSTSTRPAAEYGPLFNQVGYSTDGAAGSVRDYFYQVSYGNLTLVSTPTAWVTLPNTEAYYGANSGGNDIRPREMVVDAINAADTAGVDFSQYDTDGDGWIDAIDIIHSGYGEEVTGAPSTAIWSHRWFLFSNVPAAGGLAIQKDGVWISSYHTEPALRSYVGQNIIRIGVICHETGHFFGLPDLYDTDGTGSGGSGEGIGSWGLMSSGNWGADGGSYPHRPVHMCGWSKMQLGWIDPTRIHTRTGWSLPRVEDNAISYMVREGLPSAEYFLVSTRNQFGFDGNLLGGGGLEILHVDDANLDNNTPYDLHITFEEADGNWSLMGTIRAQTGDPWPGSSASTTFGPATTPNTNSNPSLSGSPSTITVTSISSVGNPMTFNLQTIVPWLDVPAVSTGNYNVTWTASAGATQYELQEGTAMTATTYSDNCNGEAQFRDDWVTLGAIRRVVPPGEADSVYLAQLYDPITATSYDEFQSLKLRRKFRVTGSTTISYDIKYGLSSQTKDENVGYVQIRRTTETAWTTLRKLSGYGLASWNALSESGAPLTTFAGSECELRFVVVNNSGTSWMWYNPGDPTANWPHSGFAVEDISINNVQIPDHSWSTLSTNATSPYPVSKGSAGTFAYRVRATAYGSQQDWSNIDEIQVQAGPVITAATVADLGTANGTDTGLAAADAGYANERSVRITVTASPTPADIRVAESQAGLTAASYVAYTHPNHDGYQLTNSDGGKDIWVQVRDAGGDSNQFNIGGVGDDIVLDRQGPGSTAISAPSIGATIIGGTSAQIGWSIFADFGPPAGLKTASIRLDYDTASGAGGYPNNIANNEANDGSYDWNPVPSINSTTVRVRATAWDRAGNSGSEAHTGDFTISTPAGLAIAGLGLRDDDMASSPLTGFTNGQTVDVALLGVTGSPTQMWLSEDATFATGGWTAYQNPTSYTFATATEEVKTVYVKINDGVTTAGGAGVSRTIELDTTPPQLMPTAATPDPAQPWIDVTYNEPVAFGVLDTGNYAITGTGSPTVQSVTYQSGDTYRLVTTSQAIGDPYQVTVTNVADRAGNSIDPSNNQASWTGVPVEVSRFKLD